MNSGNFILQNSFDANYLSAQLDSGDRLDEIAVKVIQNDCPEFLIPFRMTTVNEQISLKYKLVNTVALEYADMTLPKSVFLQLYLNLLQPFVKGKDWFLDYHRLCVDARYVYVDKHNYNVFYLYVPVDNFRSEDQEIFDFLRNVFMRIMISDDKDFQVRLFRYFGNGNVTLEGLYRLILEEKGAASPKPQMQPQMKPQIMPSQPVRPAEERQPAGIVSEKKENKQKMPEKQVISPQADISAGYRVENDEDEVVQALFGDKKSKKGKPAKKGKAVSELPDAAVTPTAGKQSGKKQDEKNHGRKGGIFGAKKKQQGNDPVQGVAAPIDAEEYGQAVHVGGQQGMADMNYIPQEINYAAMYGAGNSGSDETEIFADEAVAMGTPWLELIDFSQPGAMQRIELNFTKPYITIGRMSSDEMRPDIAFPGEFKRIGRQHARIERRGNDLFIIDLGSANHTMLDGQVLAPNHPYQLREGMELAFTVSKPLRYRVHV